MKILVQVPVHEPSLAHLRALPGVLVEVLPPPPDEDERPLPTSLIRDVDILFCAIPPTNVHEMKSLKLVQITSSGYSQLYGLGLPERLIRAANASGVNDIGIAEWCIAMIINLARDMRGMIRNQDSGIWDRSARFQRELRGSVLGIWGYGGIGRETARLAKSMGLVVHAMTRNGVHPLQNKYFVPSTGDPDGILPDRSFKSGEEIAFMGGLDFLLLAMPHTKATEGIIGEIELRALPKRAFLLNPARGPLVQEHALLRALREEWIAGAALDTHFAYPMPADHPLWRFPNVIMTPHISGSAGAQNFAMRIWNLFVQNVERFIAQKSLLNELSALQLRGE